MDELTRERFWPRPLPPPKPVEDVISRQLILIGADPIDEKTVETMREARLRAEALLRSRKLANAILAYEVKKTG